MPVLGIRPTVDIVFKLLFGNADHPGLTVSLLNAILPVLGRPRVRSVQILNPYTLAEFSREKEIVVDVRARDESGHDYQIEMQVESHPDLPRRMLDNWSRLYRRQIKKGQDYLDHNSLICVWILEEPLPDMPLWLDAADLTRRSDGSIHNADFLLIIIQLGRWRALFQSDPASPAQVLKTHEKGFTLDENILAELQGCMYLLAEGQELDPKNLPAEADRPWINESVEKGQRAFFYTTSVMQLRKKPQGF
ncbi:MAG: Rpn family recombination-promoting nuclease/putative transposase [Rectinemataceae bacterium]